MSKIPHKEEVLNTIDENKDEIVEFLQELVRIPSPEGEGHQVQKFVADYFREEMDASDVDEFKPDPEKLKEQPGFTPLFLEHGGTEIDEKPVVMGIFEGNSEEGKSLMFMGHMEAATPSWEPAYVENWEHDPWGAEIEGDIMYGKSVYNMKAGNAAGIMALKMIRDMGIELKGDVFISTNIDEDIGCHGSLEAIRRGYEADAGICPEPTELNIGIGSPGAQHFRVVVEGEATYGGGISAVDNAMKIYNSIKELSDHREETEIRSFFQENPELKTEGYPLTITVGIFEAGVWPCTTPHEAVMEGSIRHVPSEDIEDVREQLTNKIKGCARNDPFMKDHEPEIEFWEYWPDHLLKKDTPIIEDVKKSFKEVKDKEADLGMCVGDAAPFSRFGNTPSIYLGPQSPSGGELAEHLGTEEEAISIESYIELVKIYALTIIDWCGVSESD